MSTGRWLVTGGAGYIGAHVVRALATTGREVVVVDDLSTGLASRLPSSVALLQGSVVDSEFLTRALREARPDGVIHLASKKSPTESVSEPLLYGEQNVGGVLALVRAVRATGGARIVFSSSCSVYGAPDSDRVGEDAPKAPVSPYGDSKLYGERLLQAAGNAYGWGVVRLRYFNVVGAAEPGLIDTGAYNLVPRLFASLRSGGAVQVYGSDYPTPDGTCVRDYVDVEDVASAHVRAVDVLEQQPLSEVYNVGRGRGSSVLEVLDAVRTVSGVPFPHELAPRRPGDPARIVGRVDRIAAALGWSARRNLDDMVGSAWAAERAMMSR